MRPFGLTANRTRWEMMGSGLISEAQAANIGALVAETGDLLMKSNAEAWLGAIGFLASTSVL
jgi:hypothetical protein